MLSSVDPLDTCTELRENPPKPHLPQNMQGRWYQSWGTAHYMQVGSVLCEMRHERESLYMSIRQD